MCYSCIRDIPGFWLEIWTAVSRGHECLAKQIQEASTEKQNSYEDSSASVKISVWTWNLNLGNYSTSSSEAKSTHCFGSSLPWNMKYSHKPWILLQHTFGFTKVIQSCKKFYNPKWLSLRYLACRVKEISNSLCDALPFLSNLFLWNSNGHKSVLIFNTLSTTNKCRRRQKWLHLGNLWVKLSLEKGSVCKKVF